MKNPIKTIIAIALITACTMATASGGLYANAETTGITVAYGINIRVNGVLFQPADASGNPVEPFIYAGTTYVPIRAISDLYGASINWNGNTRTVILDTTNAHELRHTGRISSNKTRTQRSMTVETGINLTVNGVSFIPKDENGNEVTVILYNGTNFVPLRAVSGIFATPIAWESNTSTVLLGTNDNISNVDTSNFNQHQLEAYGYIEQAKALFPTMKYNWEYLWNSSANLLSTCAVGIKIRERNNLPNEDWDKTEQICDYCGDYCYRVTYVAAYEDDVILERRIMSFDYNSAIDGAYLAESILFATEVYIGQTNELIEEIRALELESLAAYINDLAARYNYHERVDFIE